MAGKTRTDEATCKCGHVAATHAHVPAIGYEGACKACGCPGLDLASEELPIPQEAIEAAYELLPREPDREDVEAAIRAADEARGMKVERETFNVSKKIEGVIRPVEHYRLVSDWHPVEQFKDR